MFYTRNIRNIHAMKASINEHVLSLRRRNMSSLGLFEKPKVLIIGAGWAGYRAAHDLDKEKFDISVVSPRNHFLFTPLLPSTAVGTLEFRAIQEPVRTIPGIKYFQASVKSIDFEAKCIECTDVFGEQSQFSLPYDSIIIAPGTENNTFGVKGVEGNPHVFYLKQLEHSRAIRNRLLECFEIASSPGKNETEIKKLLTFVIVGGGPTSVEFAAELYDFIKSDVSRWYPDLYRHVHVTVVEASGHILSSFNEALVHYVEKLFISRRVELLTGTAVKEVDGDKAVLSNGRSIDFGLMVWSTGVKQTKLIEDISSNIVGKSRNGRLLIDENLRILSKSNESTDRKDYKPLKDGLVFALGDCACDVNVPLPQLAQVASQQAIYLATTLNANSLDAVKDGRVEPFKYKHLGYLASIGQGKAVFDSPNLEISDSVAKIPPLKGYAAFLLWRAAYWTKQVSITNKILILMFWFKSAVFGRDISRF